MNGISAPRFPTLAKNCNWLTWQLKRLLTRSPPWHGWFSNFLFVFVNSGSIYVQSLQFSWKTALVVVSKVGSYSRAWGLWGQKEFSLWLWRSVPDTWFNTVIDVWLPYSMRSGFSLKTVQWGIQQTEFSSQGSFSKRHFNISVSKAFPYHFVSTDFNSLFNICHMYL